MTIKWLLLSYKVPREPSANRVYVWRKLKKLGAISLQDAVWVLPSFSRTIEQLRWLTTEIEQLDGEATLWEGHLMLGSQDEALQKKFETPVLERYEAIAKELKRRDADLGVLSRHYQQTAAIDYFHSAMGLTVRDALIAAKRGNKP